MWIQGRIHGNEPFGNNVCLEFLKSLLNKDKKLLDEMTFWVIPSYNPDGSEYNWRGNALGSRPEPGLEPQLPLDVLGGVGRSHRLISGIFRCCRPKKAISSPNPKPSAWPGRNFTRIT